MRIRLLIGGALTMLGAVGPLSGMASAQDVRTAYAPVTFHAEAGNLRTRACLQLIERVYPATAWWESASVIGGAPYASRNSRAKPTP